MGHPGFPLHHLLMLTTHSPHVMKKLLMRPSYLHFVMLGSLIILLSVVLAVEGKDWTEESNGAIIPVEQDLGGILLNQEYTRKKRHIAAQPVKSNRRKKRKKQSTNCKKKPLQIKCINKKFSKRLKTMEGKMKKFANKSKVSKMEKLLTSRMDKISENLTKNTNSLSRSKTKLEEVVSSLAILQSNMSSSVLLGGAGSVTGNVFANGSTILEQLNATRSELMRIRESQLAISALVETQGQLLVEQMVRLNQLEERLYTTTMVNSNITNTTIVNSNITDSDTVAQNISSLSNFSLPNQNSTIAVSPTPSAASSNSTAGSSNGEQTSIGN